MGHLYVWAMVTWTLWVIIETNIRIYVHISLCEPCILSICRVRIHMYIGVYTYMYICIYSYMYMHKYVYIYIGVYIHQYIHTFIFTCIACIHSGRVYIYMYEPDIHCNVKWYISLGDKIWRFLGSMLDPIIFLGNYPWISKKETL